MEYYYRNNYLPPDQQGLYVYSPIAVKPVLSIVNPQESTEGRHILSILRRPHHRYAKLTATWMESDDRVITALDAKGEVIMSCLVSTKAIYDYQARYDRTASFENCICDLDITQVAVYPAYFGLASLGKLMPASEAATSAISCS